MTEQEHKETKSLSAIWYEMSAPILIAMSNSMERERRQDLNTNNVLLALLAVTVSLFGAMIAWAIWR